MILTVFSADEIEIWEGVLTFAFFPLLVLMSYLADIGKFTGRSTRKKILGVNAAELSKEELSELAQKIRVEHGEGKYGRMLIYAFTNECCFVCVTVCVCVCVRLGWLYCSCLSCFHIWAIFLRGVEVRILLLGLTDCCRLQERVCLMISL